MRAVVEVQPILAPETDSSVLDPTQAFYEKNAKRYAALTREAEIGSLHREFLVRVPQQSRVLDLGCGAGRDTRRLLQAGYRVVGIDYSARLLEIAGQYSRGHFVLGDMRQLPFRRIGVDAVWAVASLLHISKADVHHVLTDLTDVVALGGLLFTSMKKGRGEAVDGEGRFFAFYSADEWLDHLRAAKWKPVYTSVDTERRTNETIEWLLTVSERM